MKLTCKSRKAEQGFTLVELAVVMIIIGLLIGGVLKGQELIAGAQINATISQVKAYEAATSTFRDMYSAFPGDMPNGATRLANCAGPCATGVASATQGNGRLSTAVDAAPAGEALAFFGQLDAADLISGIDGTANVATFGEALPAAPIGGGFMVGWAAGAGAGAFATQTFRAGHYVALEAQASNAPTLGVTNALQAARIDRKIDDGVPNAGGVIAQPTVGACDGTTYTESAAGSGLFCVLAIRIQ